MANTDRNSTKHFFKVAGFGLAIFIAIISYAGILNGVVANGLDSFYGVVGFINLGVQTYLFVKWYKELFPKKVDNKQTERS